MRGQWVHCFKSVTSSMNVSFVLACTGSSFLRKGELFCTCQVALTERDQAHIGGLALQNAPDLEQQFLLQRTWKVAPEGAVLDALQAVVEAEVSYPGARPVLGDVIDEKIAHLLTNSR